MKWLTKFTCVLNIKDISKNLNRRGYEKALKEMLTSSGMNQSEQNSFLHICRQSHGRKSKPQKRRPLSERQIEQQQQKQLRQRCEVRLVRLDTKLIQNL